MIKEMMAAGWPDRLFLAVMVGLLLGAPVVFVALVNVVGTEQKQWEAFAAEHHCVKVGQMQGATQTGVGYGMTANGQFGPVITTSSAPSKTGWKCDDGVTYWRNN